MNRNTAAKPQVRSAPVLVPFDRPIELAPVTATTVFPGESSAGTLTAGQWNRWTQGTFRAAMLAVGLPNARAYDLRHSSSRS